MNSPLARTNLCFWLVDVVRHSMISSKKVETNSRINYGKSAYIVATTLLTV